MVQDKNKLPSKLVKWEPRNEKLITRYIQKYMDILFINEKGEIKTTKTFLLDAYLRILSQNLEFKKITSPSIKKGILFRAGFIRFKKYKKQNIFTFRQAVAAEVQRSLRRPILEFWILFPIHIPQDQLAKFRSFSVLNHKLLVRNWDFVKKNFEADKFFHDTNLQLYDVKISLETDFTPILIKSQGNDKDELFDSAERAFDFFRWLLNLQTQFGRYHMSIGGYPKPFAKILPPPIYGLFHLDGQYEQYYYNLTKYPEYKTNSIAIEQIDETRKLANRLKTIGSESDTVDLLIEAVEKYGQALDSFEWKLTFLELWQILELVTLQSKEQFSMKTVTNRINCLFKQDQFSKDLLQALYKTRNSLVHKGHFPYKRGLEEIGLLKSLAERSINALFGLVKEFPTKSSLSRYYEFASRNNQYLSESLKAVQAIQKTRKK